MRFYREVLNYIQAENEIEGAVGKIVVLAQKASPSWEATAESVAFLERCCNHGSGVEDDDLWSSTLNDFIKAAFRDLSPLKDLEAMNLFRKIAVSVSSTFRNGNDMLIWARTVKERPDGSGVLVIHVNNLERFRDLIEGHDLVDGLTVHHNLEGAILIGS